MIAWKQLHGGTSSLGPAACRLGFAGNAIKTLIRSRYGTFPKEKVAEAQPTDKIPWFLSSINFSLILSVDVSRWLNPQ